MIEEADPFIWLENRTTSETADWLASQQSLLRRYSSSVAARPVVQERVLSILTLASIDIVDVSSDIYLYSQRCATEPQAVIYLRKSWNGFPRRLLASPSGPRTSAVAITLSPNGERLAIGWREDGRDDLQVQIIDGSNLRTVVADIPPFEHFRTAITPDLTAFYSIEQQDNNRFRISFVQFAPERASPQELLSGIDSEQLNCLGICCLSRPRTLILTNRKSCGTTCDYVFIRHDKEVFTQLIWSKWPHRAQFFAQSNVLLCLTDWDAPNGRIISFEVTHAGLQSPIELVPETHEVIKSLAVGENYFIVVYVSSPWTNRLQVFTAAGEPIVISGTPSDGTIESVHCSRNGNQAIVQSSSIAKLPVHHRIDFSTNTCCLLVRPLSAFKIPEVETIKTWYESSDGTKVPISVTQRKDLALDEALPTMLTGYGGFGLIDTLRYTNRSALWLALGGRYVHAGIRGGGELGKEWHEAGRRGKKQKSFDDFISAAEWIIARGFTAPGKLAIVGGSNSGLLVGVAMTQRPDLFAAVVCFGPLLDMLRFHLFAGGVVGSLEYGSPEDPEFRHLLEAYSPYHRIKDGVVYPATLLISGDADTRCDPMHARKMTARLQQASTSGKPILLDYRRERGHAGLLPLPERIETLTNQFCFLLDNLSLELNEAGHFRDKSCAN